jgi:glutamate-1-semialdehyde aminotransferase
LPPKSFFDFRDANGDSSSDLKSLFMQEMCKRGVIMGFSLNLISYSHSDDDVTYTLDAVAEALHVIKQATEEGEIDKYLEGQKIQTVFRPVRN